MLRTLATQGAFKQAVPEAEAYTTRLLHYTSFIAASRGFVRQ